MNLPNSLSFLRIFLVLPIIYFFVIGNHLVAFWLFFVANVSDFLDGYLARAYNQLTSFGRMIDPIADKILISSMLLLLTYYGFIPFWLTLLVMLRDVLLVFFGFYLRFLGLADKLYVTFISKVNTVLQMAFVSWIMLQNAFHMLNDSVVLANITFISIIILACTTVATGLHYLYIAAKVYTDRGEIHE